MPCRCYGSRLQYLNEDHTFRAPWVDKYCHLHTVNLSALMINAGEVTVVVSDLRDYLYPCIGSMLMSDSLGSTQVLLNQLLSHSGTDLLVLSTVMVAGTKCVCVLLDAVASEFTTIGYAVNSDTVIAQSSERVTPGCARAGSSGQLMNLNITAHHSKNTKSENLTVIFVWPGFSKHHHLL